jgi:hypothetical protein
MRENGPKKLALNFVPEPSCDRPCLAALTGAPILFVYLRLGRPYTLGATSLYLIACRRKDYGTARVTAQQSLLDRKVDPRAAKVDKIEQSTYGFMQELDSRDKIATRLQPVGRKYPHRRLAALSRLPRSTFALTRTTLVLAFKSLAIMNFL